jgi:predicted secreted protein
MAAKRIQVSDDAGATWHTLPGSSGEMRRELASVNDTIFGQNWQSESPQIGNWMVTANAFFKGVAGYIAQLRIGGTPIAMTSEAMALVSGKTYQITATSKRIIDLATTTNVFDNAVNQNANVESIDYLNGTVTFKASYTPVGAITITGAYVPTTVIAKAKSFTLTQGAAEIDTTDYETALANGGWRTYSQGLRNARIEVSGIYDAASGAAAALASRAMVYIDVSPANDANTIFRGFFKRTNFGQSGDVGALEESTLTFNLYVPDASLLSAPFGWYFSASTTLNLAVRKALSAWLNGTALSVRYLPDGVAGFSGPAVVTEATLANALDGQNEFRFTFRGSGAPTTV